MSDNMPPQHLWCGDVSSPETLVFISVQQLGTKLFHVVSDLHILLTNALSL